MNEQSQLQKENTNEPGATQFLDEVAPNPNKSKNVESNATERTNIWRRNKNKILINAATLFCALIIRKLDLMGSATPDIIGAILILAGTIYNGYPLKLDSKDIDLQLTDLSDKEEKMEGQFKYYIEAIQGNMVAMLRFMKEDALRRKEERQDAYFAYIFSILMIAAGTILIILH
ncbi:TPA: hypothetical protein ACXN34_005104 [Burkholderia cepacia]